MPEVHSIAGDGAHREHFITDPSERGWTLIDAVHVEGVGVSGLPNGSLTGPWLLANAPLYDALLEGTILDGQPQVRFHPGQAWTNITLPYAPSVNSPPSACRSESSLRCRLTEHEQRFVVDG